MTIKPIVPNKKQQFVVSNDVDSPLDLYNHLPFQLAVVTNLLQLNAQLLSRYELIPDESIQLQQMV